MDDPDRALSCARATAAAAVSRQTAMPHHNAKGRLRFGIGTQGPDGE
jgi:hypothetical protein